MKYSLKHKTIYEYKNSVKNYHGLTCIKPIDNISQKLLSFALDISPLPAECTERLDFFGNTLHYFAINQPHNKLIVEASSTIERFSPVVHNNLYDATSAFFLEEVESNRKFRNQVWQYLLPSQYIYWDAAIQDFARQSFSKFTSLYASIIDLCNRIFNEFEFNSEFSDVNTPLGEVLASRKGVCQDFSHLAIACIRSMGFAARYVSGYLETMPPPGKAKLQGSDASHAWVSFYIPNVGWCEFDPTNNIVPYERHIITAYGRDYADVVPLKGIIYSSGGHKLKVEVDVIPMY